MPSHLMLTLEMDDTRIGLVTGIETAPAKPRVVEQPTHMIHRHNVFEYHYLYKGSFCMACNEQLVTLQPGQVLVIGPDVFHHYDSYSEDLGTMVCQFTLEQIPGRKGTLYDKFAATFLTEAGYCILEADMDLFARLRKLQIAGNIHEDSAVRFRAIMEMIFLDLCRPVSLPVAPPLPDTDTVVRAYEIAEFISGHFAENITADDMAAHLAISRRQLFRCLKDTMHTTWTQLLTKQRIQYAIQLLGEGISPSEAAAACGFSSYNGFAKAFIREQGVSPGEFVKMKEIGEI